MPLYPPTVGANQALLTPTATKTGPYTAGPGDLVPVDTTGGNVTITLPTAPMDRATVGVKQLTRGGTNTVAVTCGGTDRFAVAAAISRTITLTGESLIAQYQASTALWFVTSTDMPLTQLDARYPQTVPLITARNTLR